MVNTQARLLSQLRQSRRTEDTVSKDNPFKGKDEPPQMKRAAHELRTPDCCRQLHITILGPLTTTVKPHRWCRHRASYFLVPTFCRTDEHPHAQQQLPRLCGSHRGSHKARIQRQHRTPTKERCPSRHQSPENINGHWWSPKRFPAQHSGMCSAANGMYRAVDESAHQPWSNGLRFKNDREMAPLCTAGNIHSGFIRDWHLYQTAQCRL